MRNLTLLITLSLLFGLNLNASNDQEFDTKEHQKLQKLQKQADEYNQDKYNTLDTSNNLFSRASPSSAPSSNPHLT